MLTQPDLLTLGIIVPPAEADALILELEGRLSSAIGVPDLDEKLRNVKLTQRRDDSFIEVPFGPIGSVQSVKLGGTALTASDFYAEHWTIHVYAGIPCGTIVEIAYNSGYTITTLPDALKAALQAEAETILSAAPQGIKSERVDEFVVQYTDDSSGLLEAGASSAIQRIVRPYRRARY